MEGTVNCLDLLHAAGKGDLVALRHLLDSGCDPDFVNPATGATPLYNACFTNQVEAARLLLARGADPNKRLVYYSPVDGRVDSGLVALMLCSSPEIVGLLLGAGADPGGQDDAGNTVLMRLVGVASSKIFETLIRAGADVTARANDGRSAADLVRKKLEWWRRFAPAKNIEHQADLRQILDLVRGGP